ELQEVYARLRSAGGNIIEQGQTSCCYAKSEKSWTDDPAGISWETFFTTGESNNTATAPESVRRVLLTKRDVASRKLPRSPCLKRWLAARHRARTWRIALSTSCSCVPATRHARSWPRPS